MLLPGVLIAIAIVIYMWLNSGKGGQNYISDALIIVAVTSPYWSFRLLFLIFGVSTRGRHRKRRKRRSMSTDSEVERRTKQDARDAALETTRKLSIFTAQCSRFATPAQLKVLDAAAETLREIRKGITYSE